MKLIGYHHPESDSTWCIDCDNGEHKKSIIFTMEVVPLYNNEKQIKNLVCDQCGRKLKKVRGK